MGAAVAVGHAPAVQHAAVSHSVEALGRGREAAPGEQGQEQARGFHDEYDSRHGGGRSTGGSGRTRYWLWQVDGL